MDLISPNKRESIILNRIKLWPQSSNSSFSNDKSMSFASTQNKFAKSQVLNTPGALGGDEEESKIA